MTPKPILKRISQWACLGLLLPATGALNAAEKTTITIPHATGDIVVDGKLDEAFWANATKVDLGYETRPSENTTPSQKTTAYIIENGESLFVALVAEDSNPEQIRASLKNRDRVWNDDMMGFKVDTFNTGRKAYNFFVNPLGVQMDSIEDDVSGNEDGSWDAIWNSAGLITETGYTVEMEVPFKVLRFEDNSSVKTWGIDFMRMLPRDYQYRFAFSPVDRSVSCFVCQIQKAEGLEKIESGNNLEVVPYVSMAQNDTKDLDVSTDWNKGSADTDGGVDIRWGVTDNSVLNATINPDFSQVESDRPQLEVNNTFSLFYNERRPFFLEGNDYFRTNVNILHTRNIANPDYGIKYTGKVDNHSFGVLLADDQSTSVLLPGVYGSDVAILEENGQNVSNTSSAARYTYDVGDNSRIGAMITSRSAGDYKNDLLSIDGKYYLSDSDYIEYQLMYSDTDNSEQLVNDYGLEANQSGTGAVVAYVHRDRDWRWNVRHFETDIDFRADLGFMSQVGTTKDVIGLGHNWYGESDDFFSKISLSGDIDATWDFEGQRIEDEAEINLRVEGKGQLSSTFITGNRNVYYDNQWFDQTFYYNGLNLNITSELRAGYDLNYGDVIDYTHVQAAKNKGYYLWAEYQVTPNWFVNASFNNTTFEVGGSELFSADTINIDTVYQFNTQSYIKFIWRHQKIDFNKANYADPDQLDYDEGSIRQLLYAYKWNPRTVFFLGYTDTGVKNDTLARFEQTGRSLFTKFSYAFQL